jgi:tetratricopeptide (TPR) repeat protein
MKKFLVAAVLAFATAAFAQTDNAQQPSAPQQKTIKDPAEYNAYITATGLTDPNQKAAALEAFVQQYPNSVVKEDALAAAMAAYQQAGNLNKSAEVAGRVLQANPNNVPALAVSVYTKRAQAVNTQNLALLNEAGDLAVRGLTALQNWQKPEGVSDADFQKQKTGLSTIFNGAAGAAAMQKKDYANAQKYLRDAVAANPNSADDTYSLALAYLSPKPTPDENTINGLWYIARALNLVAGNAAAEKQIGDYGLRVYKKFHGSDEGWQQLVAQAKTSPTPPTGFTISKYVPPSPAQQAADMVAKGDIAKMEFADWIFILTSGNQQAADQVWNTLKGKALRFVGQVIDANKTTVSMAVTADGIEAKKPEVMVTMAAPMRVPPAVGSNFQVQAVPDSYDVGQAPAGAADAQNPRSFLMKMVDGEQIGAKPTPAKKPAPKRPVTRKK